MFVAKYHDWLAQIIFKDGTVFFFDGAKDMFKFYFNLKRYSPSKKTDDIRALYVTDYYSLLPVDGFSAFYVIGSDVYGPMGRELIPFGKNQEALEFKRDHKGKEILKFQQVTPAVVKGLD
jgi:nitrous oxide reductase accessory protein NosL